jgi:hypothetical protein|tara:strand:+ start:175 stop:372 length:198 start_codon:yes stop_codon:yes gene_type:complete
MTKISFIRLVLGTMSLICIVFGMLIVENTNGIIATMSPTDWLMSLIGGTFVLVGIMLTFITWELT